MPRKRNPVGIAAGKVILAIQKAHGEAADDGLAQKVLDRAHTLLQASQSNSVVSLLDGRSVTEYLSAEWVETHPAVRPSIEALVAELGAGVPTVITTEDTNLATVRAYLAELGNGAIGDALGKFFTADAIQTELPNKLNPHGGQSDLPTILKRAEIGQQLLQSQRFEIVSEVASGTRVAVEAKWSAVIAVPLESLAAGSTMTAHFAMFFELRDGLICAQRNYDCFEPWGVEQGETQQVQ